MEMIFSNNLLLLQQMLFLEVLSLPLVMVIVAGHNAVQSTNLNVRHPGG